MSSRETEPRQRRSCLAKAIMSGVDGGILGGVIGSLMASRAVLSVGLSVESVKLIARSGVASAFSFGGFLAVYNGGICSLERFRKRRDMANPFIVGALVGVGGAIPGYLTPQPQAPWAFRNPRALFGAGLSSALLCSFFWSLSSGSSSSSESPASSPTSPPSEQAAPALEQLQAKQSLPALSSPRTLPSNTSLDEGQLPEAAGAVDPPLAEGLSDPALPEPSSLPEALPAYQTAPSEQLQDPWASK